MSRLHTALCELFGIEYPIVQAGMGMGSSAALAVAVSNAGALGSLGVWRRPPEDLDAQLALIREGTSNPFAMNHLVTELDEEVFQMTLDARPPVISFALGDPGDLVTRAHEAGSLVMHQVTTVAQAIQAAERGVDVIVAQGTEGGGYVGEVATMALVPQVVDAVRPLPVVAAGGIADGRGLAAALMLGAVGVNVGTRFLATEEARINPAWKQRIVDASAEDTVRFELLNRIMRLPGGEGYGTALRTLRSDFVNAWIDKPEEAAHNEELKRSVPTYFKQGRVHELFPAAGHSAGLVHEILPAGEVVRRMVADAESALQNKGSAGA